MLLVRPCQYLPSWYPPLGFCPAAWWTPMGPASGSSRCPGTHRPCRTQQTRGWTQAEPFHTASNAGCTRAVGQGVHTSVPALSRHSVVPHSHPPPGGTPLSSAHFPYPHPSVTNLLLLHVPQRPRFWGGRGCALNVWEPLVYNALRCTLILTLILMNLRMTFHLHHSWSGSRGGP